MSEIETFRSKPLEEKENKLKKLLEKSPDKIPIIFERHPLSKLKPNSKSLKFISTRNIKLLSFTKQIREMWELDKDVSLFFSTTNNHLVKNDLLIGELYEKFKDKDGFLYIYFREIESLG